MDISMTPRPEVADLEAMLAAARPPADSVASAEIPWQREDELETPGSQARRILDDSRLDLARLLDPNRPEREWVVHGLIPAGASVSLIAPAGKGKSLLVLGLAVAVARGHRAFADLTIPRSRRVLYVDMENTEDDLAERLPAFGIKQDDALPDLIYLHLPPLSPLDTFEGGAVLANLCTLAGLRAGDVVVLDSYQRVVAGPEDKADTSRDYYRHTGRGLKQRGLTVIRTDNTGHIETGRARGTSGKRDDVDVEWILERDAERAVVKLSPGKARISGLRPISVELHSDPDTDRVTYSSATDPFRAQVLTAMQLLDEAAIPSDLGQIKAWAAVREMATTRGINRDAVRAAQRERTGR